MRGGESRYGCTRVMPKKQKKEGSISGPIDGREGQSKRMEKKHKKREGEELAQCQSREEKTHERKGGGRREFHKPERVE